MEGMAYGNSDRPSMHAVALQMTVQSTSIVKFFTSVRCADRLTAREIRLFLSSCGAVQEKVDSLRIGMLDTYC